MATEGEDKVKAIADQKAAEKAAAEAAAEAAQKEAAQKEADKASPKPSKNERLNVSVKEADGPKLSQRTLDEQKAGREALERTGSRVAAKAAEPVQEK